MPGNRRQTLSDTPGERRIYELASKRELTFLIDTMKTLLATERKPRGWTKTKNGPGRPRKMRRGRKEVHGWRSCTIALVVKEYLELTYREAESFLRGNPDLCARMGFVKPPSHSTLNRAMDKLGPAGIKRLNQRVVAKAKGGSPAALRRSGWQVMGPGSSSRVPVPGRR